MEILQQSHVALGLLVEQRTSALQHLSSRLLCAQDEERRRIARELHDSVGQYLTALKINLDILARSSLGTRIDQVLAESSGLLIRRCPKPARFPICSTHLCWMSPVSLPQPVGTSMVLPSVAA